MLDLLKPNCLRQSDHLLVLGFLPNYQRHHGKECPYIHLPYIREDRSSLTDSAHTDKDLFHPPALSAQDNKKTRLPDHTTGFVRTALESFGS